MTKSLKNYILSIEALKAGNREEAEKHLAECIGIPELTPYARQNLDTLSSADDPSELIMKLIIHESKKE